MSGRSSPTIALSVPALSAWALESAAATATPTPSTTGVSSERGIASFLVFLVLIGGILLYRYWRFRR